jgi:hypothetical protein
LAVRTKCLLKSLLLKGTVLGGTSTKLRGAASRTRNREETLGSRPRVSSQKPVSKQEEDKTSEDSTLMDDYMMKNERWLQEA